MKSSKQRAGTRPASSASSARLQASGLRTGKRALAASLLVWVGSLDWGAALQAQQAAATRGPGAAESSLQEELRWLQAERVTVTSVSKRPEELFEAAAAVFVITGEELRRSGVKSLAEALRLAPGMQVAQITQSQWAISARGFNALNADKLLVMIDGRTVYSPIFNGVFWDLQDYLLEDIERIEIVRGPGGTLWGANAVNGVVNILTKDSRQSQGTYAMAGGGTEARGFGSLRHGLAINEDLFFRAYARYSLNEQYPDGHDGSDFRQFGARLDWHWAEAKATLQGDYFLGHHDKRVVIPDYAGPIFYPTVDGTRRNAGGNVLARFERSFSEDSDLQIQSYFSRLDDSDPARSSEILTQIFDVELQHRLPLPWNQNLVYGAGYRYQPTEIGNSLLFTFSPNRRQHQIFSGFVQDEIRFFDDTVRVTIGSKFEHHDMTGLEVQPNARIAWLPSSRQTVWAAVSRAVQVPGLANHDITSTPITGAGPIPGAFIDPRLAAANPFFVAFEGNPALQAQELISYEFGYRLQATDSLSFDVTTFYGRYHDLFAAGDPAVRTVTFPPATEPSWLLFGILNGGSADLAGVETTARWRVTEDIRVVGSYSFLHERRPRRSDEGGDAAHLATLRLSLDLPANLELDVIGRYVDDLHFGDPASVFIDAYVGLDVRLAWKPHKNFEVAVVGQNLVEARRIEFQSLPVYTTPVTPVPRGMYAALTVRF